MIKKWGPSTKPFSVIYNIVFLSAFPLIASRNFNFGVFTFYEDIRMRRVMQVHKPGESELEKFTREIEDNPLDSTAYYKRATLKAEMGDLTGASQDFQKSIELEMQEAREYYNLGISKYKKGNLREASILFDKAIALDWRFAEAYYQRGKLKIDTGDYSSAMEDFSTAIKLNKDLKFS